MEPAAAIKLPGFGLPVDFLPDAEHRFPVLVGNSKIDFKANTLTIRELCMLQFIEEITNKPDWWVKVHDAEIAARWKVEALEMNWAAFLKYADFTPAMADACIQELKLKADLFQKTSLVPVFDYTTAVIKSDDLIPEPLWQALSQGVKLLEDVPEDEKDWHPGSDGKVLDLVHPSLWPLVYGKSRILPPDRRIGLSDALDNCGMGDVIQEPAPPTGRNRHCTSTKFQWLPCDVSVENGRAKIESYINNLHPVKHASLYPVIERFIEKALPAWDLLYRWPEDFETQRLTTDSVSVRCRTRRNCAKSPHACEPKARPTRDDEPRRSAYEDPYSGSEVSESEEEIDDGDDEDEEEEDEEEEEEEEDDDDSQDEGNRNQRTESEGLPNPSQLLVQMGSPKQDEPESEYETEQYDSAEDRANAAEQYTKDEEEEEDEDDEDEERDPNHVSENEVKRRDWRWFYKTHPVNAPEPSTEPPLKLSASDVKTTDFLRPKQPQPQVQGDPPSRRLQVIVKLANIHLTPERPSYDGGSWHVEGQLNEHICATALFYHDSDNITPSRLELRTQANREGLDKFGRLRYEQYDWRTIRRTFAIARPGGGPTTQHVGSVLTRDRRALFFPNVLQHRVAPFRLADPARRGHRKILALFLVDPAVPVVSTANVAPQQKHWWLGRLGLDGQGRGSRLPPELTAMMLRNVEFPMDWEAAAALRRELMEERTASQSQTADKMGRVEWNFCEH